MEPHTSFDRDVIVTRYLTVSQPGNYTLMIHVHLPYSLAPASTPIIGLADDLIQSSGTVFTQDRSIPITVKPADPAARRASAEAQTQSILHPLHPSDMGKRPLLIDALCTMPEAEAGPSWEVLATGPDIMALREEVARSLSHAYSAKAVDILAEIAWETPIRQTDHDTEGAASDSLAKLYDSGNAALRIQIWTLYWKHGVRIGNPLPILQVMD